MRDQIVSLKQIHHRALKDLSEVLEKNYHAQKIWVKHYEQNYQAQKI